MSELAKTVERRAMEMEIEALRETVARLRAKLNIAGVYAPPILDCKSCLNPYAAGYLCGCGRDNSLTDKEWQEEIEDRA